jgi:hypothetical protein
MPKTVADKLRAAIQAELDRGTSLREIARRADVAPGVVQKFMSGKSCTLESAEAMGAAVGFRLG